MELEKLKYNQKLAFGDEVYLAKEIEPLIVQKEKEICHQKRKRCLSMAGRCEDRLKTIQAGVIRTYEYPYLMTCPAECTPTYHFYTRWQKRWLELADMYKEE